jgi:hypothetical protein
LFFNLGDDLRVGCFCLAPSGWPLDTVIKVDGSPLRAGRRHRLDKSVLLW